MQGRRPRTSRFLLIAAMLLCIVLGGCFIQSSAYQLSSERSADILVFSEQEDSDTTEKTEQSSILSPTMAALSPTPVPSSAPSPTSVSQKKVKSSPEAASGVWTANGSKWMFLVDGTPYTGWLTDTDGKLYYFNKKGIMKTGWIDLDEKRYYLDQDGILQTGDITLDGETYHLEDDGSLKGYKPEKKESKKENTKQKESTKKKSSEKKQKKAAQKTKKGQIAITFDDGPSSFTNRLLDCLEKNNAKATFFMVGTEISSFPDEVKRMAKLGCSLGNHSSDHTNLATISGEEIQANLAKTDALLKELTGHEASVIRPPYGEINDTVKASVSRPLILWSVDTLDWESQDADQIVASVMEEAQDGAIILLHDIFSTTVDAAEIFIPELIKEGYELVTVQELAAAHGTELLPGVTYSSMK